MFFQALIHHGADEQAELSAFYQHFPVVLPVIPVTLDKIHLTPSIIISMTRNAALFTSCLSALLLTLLISCNPEEEPLVTSVKGTVIDKVTGEPVPGAGVVLSYVVGKAPDFSYINDVINAGANGQYYYNRSESFQFYQVQTKGYLAKGNGFPGIKRGEVNYITLQLVPRDGEFNLQIENTSSVAEVLYVGIYSPAMEKENNISNGLIYRDTFYPGPMETIRTLVDNISSEEMMGIYWDFKPLPYHFKTAPFSDSFFVARNDTASFTISF